MNFTYQNNILYLPCVEGRSLQRGKSVSILFEVDASFIAGTKHPFNYNGSTPKYPTRVKKTSDENVIPEKYKIDLLNEKINGKQILSIVLAFIGALFIIKPAPSERLRSSASLYLSIFICLS